MVLKTRNIFHEPLLNKKSGSVEHAKIYILHLNIWQRILIKILAFYLIHNGDEKMNIDEIKKECQTTTNLYIVGLKFVTTETVDQVMSSIKRDIQIYDKLCRFIIFNNRIELGLCTNATPAIYYFTEQSTIFEEVLKQLEELCKEKNLGITDIRDL